MTMTMTDRPRLDGEERAVLRQSPPADWAKPSAFGFTPITVEAPAARARRWWQRGPSAAELAHLDRERGIREACWDTARRVIVANPKSSAKTPTTVILTGIMARIRGGSVIGWDASEAAGSLHARTSGTQTHCVADVAEEGAAVYSTLAKLGPAVAVQPSTGHIMGSLTERHLTADHVRAVTEALDPFYAVQFADTGANAIHSETFQQVLDLADAAVVPTVLTADSVNKAAQFIYELRKANKLTGRVVAIVSEYGQQVTTEQAVHTLTTAGAAHVQVVPYDRHIAEGGAIDPALLSDLSQRAWTAAASELTHILERPAA
jgi:MinD-like ATPase involved in chromosome partitioning or flagellar assembly